MKRKLTKLFSALILLTCANQTTHAAISFTVTPNAVSNNYSSDITLQITGLTNGETVVVQKFLNLNANGVIDSSDWLVQQFNLTDGQPGMVIGGVTNFNVPGDLNPTNGAVTAALNFPNGDFVQNIVGNYLYKLSTPGDPISTLVRPFAVTNSSFPQSISGTVVDEGTSVAVPGALVVWFSGPKAAGPGLGQAFGGVVANQAGAFTLRVPVGVHKLIAVGSNRVFNYTHAPVFELSAGQQVTTNLVLITATNSISGRIVDANNAAIGLGGVLIHGETTNSVVSAAFTDSSGNFSLPTDSDTLRFGVSEGSLIVQGYVGWDNSTNVAADMSPLNFSVSKATALIYGTIKDNWGNPLPNVAVDTYDEANHDVEVNTDTNGNYVVGVLGGLPNNSWSASIDTEISPTNYLYPDSTSTNLSAGEAVQADFIAFQATNHITGSLKDDHSNPISGVRIFAGIDMNSSYYEQETDTDTNGNYWLNVPNGTWDVGVVPLWWGDSDGLPQKYLQPSDQTVTIAGNNAVANFTAILPTNYITGFLKDDSGSPIAGQEIDAYATINGVDYDQATDTDTNGNYRLDVVNGTWGVGVSVNPDPNYIFPGLDWVVISNNSPVVNIFATRIYTFTNRSGVFTFTHNNGTISIMHYFGSAAVVTIPGRIGNMPVTRIGADAFASANLTSVVIPSDMAYLDSWAFELCSNLTGVFFQGNAPSADSTVFAADNNPTVYYLPGTSGWGQFLSNVGLSGVLWNPQIETGTADFGVQTNQFGFDITGANDLIVVVEAAANLANPNWIPVATNTLNGGTSLFSNPGWTNYPGRFYRLNMP